MVVSPFLWLIIRDTLLEHVTSQFIVINTLIVR